MGDISAEPSMEDILSSIKRIIAEEGDAAATATRARKASRLTQSPRPDLDDFVYEEILELSDPVRDEDTDVRQSYIHAPASATPEAEPILSARATQATRGPLDALSRLVVKPEVSGADTLEGLVREMIRPMLRDWMDTHLPGMVEQMVAQEIARITSQR
ncbi:DUF2497 domain-containing protein [Sphingomonas qilianensis]|uniref:DUF2497 domain-containing protein n=1 Tax=Sphingomonas qilianensis TaxID=1736690 RepID=A0ABU9XRU6_9SPHN